MSYEKKYQKYRFLYTSILIVETRSKLLWQDDFYRGTISSSLHVMYVRHSDVYVSYTDVIWGDWWQVRYDHILIYNKLLPQSTAGFYRCPIE